MATAIQRLPDEEKGEPDEENPKDLSQHGKTVRWECPKVATGRRDVMAAFFDVGKHHMPRRNDPQSGRSLASKSPPDAVVRAGGSKVASHWYVVELA